MRAIENIVAFVAAIVMFFSLMFIASEKACGAERVEISPPPASLRTGFSLGVRLLPDNDIPGGWFMPDTDPDVYRLDATMFVTGHRLRVALQPYMAGNDDPQLVGMRASVGWQFGSLHAGLFHDSCHNLDGYGAVWSDRNWRVEHAPKCRVNGIAARWTWGTTFQPLW